MKKVTLAVLALRSFNLNRIWIGVYPEILTLL